MLHCLRLTSRVNVCLIQFNFGCFLIKFKILNGKYAITCYSPMRELPASHCKRVTPEHFHYLYNRTTPTLEG